ncbi:MAG: tRNA (guanosine(37)-N1)-methyltransferase TrmD [Nitriliruptoraceae bacterium]
MTRPPTMPSEAGAALRIDIVTLFPAWFEGPLTTSLLGRAIADGLVDVRVHDLRRWGLDNVHRTVDDAPYGGGAGMVLRADVVIDAVEDVWNDASRHAEFVAGGERPRTLLLTPRGPRFDQDMARELAAGDRFVVLCGRYEGFDQRVHDLVATDEVSVGDYVLLGGEVAAAAIVESVARLVPRVLGNDASNVDESFSGGLLEYPHYTRPPDVRGHGVPDVLTSGDHAAIAQWRRDQAQRITERVRPDLSPSDRDRPDRSG